MIRKDKDFLNKLLENHDPKKDGLTKAKEWKKKYKEELLDYTYIDTLEKFKNLGLGGIIKPFSLSDDLRKGGILVKISHENNKWYALLSTPKKGYIWKIHFDYNFIFYHVPHNVNISDDSTEAFKNIIDKFIGKDEIEMYTESANEVTKDRDERLKNLIETYKK